MKLQTVGCFSVYKVPLLLVHGTREQINRWLKRRKWAPLTATAAGTFRVYPGGLGDQALVLLVRKYGGAQELATLTHEIVHAATYTFRKVGIQVHDEQDEPFAYYVESLMFQCLDGLRRVPQ